MSIAATSNTVLKNFIAGANAQYRDAGLSQYQMRLQKDGTVTVPGRPSPRFESAAPAGSAAPEQAQAGAAPGPAPAAGANVKRSGPAPTVSNLAQASPESFSMAWKPVQGAKQYGIWQDGVLIGHVPSPKFAGQLAKGGSGVLQVDAVRADGTRSALTPPLQVTRTPEDKFLFAVVGAKGTPLVGEYEGQQAAGAAGAPATAPAAAAS